ncbi:MAG: fatty acid desaturase [Planctomycetota bacterium]
MRNYYDFISVAYIVVYLVAIVSQWWLGFSWPLFAISLVTVVCLQVVHHNHVHLGIWHSRRMNRLTNLLISLATAVPTAMLYGGHLKNHHVHNHGPGDTTRTYRFGGDHNHLLGYLLHPFQALFVLIPKFCREFWEGWPTRSRFSRDLLLQSTLVGILSLGLLWLDWQNFLLLVLVPQLFGVHWLLGSNYLQHAHCDDQSDVNYARNFTGPINYLLLNVGFHTAHHDNPRAHWSTLRQIHERTISEMDPRLCCPSFAGYLFRTFFLGIFFESYRSRSLRNPVE